MVYTTAALILDTLARAGLTHAFANWGNDHPAFLEHVARQRQQQQQRAGSLPTNTTQPAAPAPALQIHTCPTEMLALSAAHAYTQRARASPLGPRAALVLVHVDVGTQALAGAVHNADRGRAPVVILAGAPPRDDGAGGESVRGVRNEWPMWVQGASLSCLVLRSETAFTLGGADMSGCGRGTRRPGPTCDRAPVHALHRADHERAHRRADGDARAAVVRPPPCEIRIVETRLIFFFFSLCYSEIAELMALKSKHGAGGEYSPDWRPKVRPTSSGSFLSHLHHPPSAARL